ncbi:glycoside hydrolase family 71/99-like protein [Formosa haliotis]|uniref:glycoside hydrolase family 71/99-like protein n=1 Tax=Formosa haliotis TaxID=1555194 RepID=UPI000824E105|nr:glycoside hydrolase family 71/99-like protein [Formosa haliotis]
MKIALFKQLLTCLFVVVNINCSDDTSDTKPQKENDELEVLDAVPVSKTNKMKVYMHYMAWFETNESSENKQWGYHWTMANKNPNNTDADGKREIASHYYPLIGPYHSGDKNVIENHLLLMKYAGIDGILIDWYGTYNLNDYALVKENTEQVIAMLEAVGLEYAIVYEDRFLQNIVDANLAPTVESAAKQDMRYIQKKYFSDVNYIHLEAKPLLLNFGPITLKSPEAWTDVFSVLNTKPTFLTLWNQSYEAGENAQGEYAWVYQNNNFLSDFYTTSFPKLKVGMAAAYPGFEDFYKEGGTNTDIGFTISHNNGATLNETLSLATHVEADYLQLITWNDFGEGTMFEPTQEFGYRYINTVKQFTGVQYFGQFFENIGELFQLRESKKSNVKIQKQLDQAFYYFVSMQPDKAIKILNEVE